MLAVNGPPFNMQRQATIRIRECRDDLIENFVERIREVGTPENVLPKDRFYPVNDLQRIFTREVVTAILRHECLNCRAHLPNGVLSLSVRDEVERILRTDESLSLFALLLSLRYPFLIAIFTSRYDPVHSPRYFTMRDLLDLFRHLPYRTREPLAADFTQHMYQFSVPQLNNGHFTDYHGGTILPYLREEQMTQSQGGFGRVFKLWVHRDYCTLDGGRMDEERDAIVLVRKELISEDINEFVREKINLELIRTLQHAHLVRIQKTYQLGGKFNILFPHAKTDLHEYLRRPHWLAPTSREMHRNPLWPQVQGITDALRQIIHFRDPEDPTQSFFGSHLDLKPSNVLVDFAVAGREALRITDFGQASFRDPTIISASQFLGGGGTDAYAPPEYLDRRADERYDIFCLGIIVLEILTFTIRGCDGLTNPESGLDIIRCTEYSGHTNHRFYDGTGSSATLKQSILRFMDGLLTDVYIQDNQSRLLVDQLVGNNGLIRKMLITDRRRRASIDDVMSSMRTIFSFGAIEEGAVRSADVIEEGETVLIHLDQVGFYPMRRTARESERMSVLMLENLSHRVRIFLGSNRVAHIWQRQSQQTELVFQHQRMNSNNTFEFSFSDIREGYAAALQGSAFVLEDANMARRLQSALIGHHVSQRWQIGQVKIRRCRHFVADSLQRLMGQPRENLVETFQGAWIEIWIEKNYTDQERATNATAQTTVQAGHRLRRQVNLGKGCALGRVVIYLVDSVLVLPFAKESRIINKKEEVKEKRCQQLMFERMDKGKSRFFTGYHFTSRNELSAGIPIPMYHENLSTAERAVRQELQEVSVHFEFIDDTYEFFKLYKNEKAIWQHRTKGEKLPQWMQSGMPVD